VRTSPKRPGAHARHRANRQPAPSASSYDGKPLAKAKLELMPSRLEARVYTDEQGAVTVGLPVARRLCDRIEHLDAAGRARRRRLRPQRFVTALSSGHRPAPKARRPHAHGAEARRDDGVTLLGQ